MGLANIKNFSDLKTRFNEARKTTGKSFAQLVIDSIRFRYGKTGISFSEFFGYKLYDDKALSKIQLDSFVSASASKQIWNKLNPRKFWGVVVDKVTFQLAMERMGFAQPKLLALYSKTGRSVPGVCALHDLEQIEEFLTKKQVFPIFAKPVNSYRSFGSIGIESVDPGNATVCLQNDEEIPISKLLQTFSEWNEYLFQARMDPHESLVDISGSSISTIRMVVLFKKNGPELFRVVWKIPKKENMADNFWRLGNLAAQIDPKDGQVYSLIQSSDAGYVELAADSLLGKRFLSSSPPMFAEATELVLKASRAYSMFSYQAWDIALTQAGPVALELNHNGDIEMLQVGARMGILDGQFSELLRQKKLCLRNTRRWFAVGKTKSHKA